MNLGAKVCTTVPSNMDLELHLEWEKQPQQRPLGRVMSELRKGWPGGWTKPAKEREWYAEHSRDLTESGSLA